MRSLKYSEIIKVSVAKKDHQPISTYLIKIYFYVENIQKPNENTVVRHPLRTKPHHRQQAFGIPQALPDVSRLSDRCPRVSPGVPGSPRVSPGVPGCPRVSPGVPGCPRVSPGVPGCPDPSSKTKNSLNPIWIIQWDMGLVTPKSLP